LSGPLDISEALELVLARAVPLELEDVPAADASGRVLASPAVAGIDLPPFPSSAMDGFAIRSEDAPGRLAVVGTVAAGKPAARPLEAGQAMGISTGAVVPEGADAVAPIEDVEDLGDTVVVPREFGNGANVRARGSDLLAGATVVASGVRLGGVRLGALAASGITSVRCRRRPRVVIVVTGSELRSPGGPLAPGEIYEANGVMLATQAESAGADVQRLAPVRDDPAATRDALARGLESDVLITSGGVSMGVHDLVRGLESELGVEEVFWRVLVRPGKPVAFGVRGTTLVFGLPGNPMSSLVGFELFVRPALLALQGLAEPRPSFRPGCLAGGLEGGRDRDWVLRARSRVEEGQVVLEPLSGQESHMLARAAAADSLVLVPRGAEPLAAGAAVVYLPIA
jgi:molybdopterin molybdotransferase